MTCPKCHGGNARVQIVQTGARTSVKNKGCLYGISRALLVVCTGGLWLVFGKKRTTGKTKFSFEKTAVCDDCGHTWRL